MLLTKAFTKFGKTLWVGNRKRNARKSKLKTYEAAEVLEDRVLMTTVYGDFNGDDVLDSATGDQYADVPFQNNAGSVEILYSGGLVGEQTLSENGFGIEGSAENGDQFGASLAVGDFNGDGYDDLAVGVPGQDVSGKSDAGAIHVFYGSQNGLVALNNRVIHQNSIGVTGRAETNDGFGRAIAAGNFNGDAFDDLAVGVWAESFEGTFSTDNYAGSVNVFLGSSTGIARGTSLNQDTSGIKGNAEDLDLFGSTLVSFDFDGDGYDDLAIGVPGETIERSFFKSDDKYAGAVNIVYGSRSGLTAIGNQIFRQGANGVQEDAEDGDRFGSSLEGGDFDGDGFYDLVIGVQDEKLDGVPQTGVVHVLYGSDGVGLTGNRDQVFSHNSSGIDGISKRYDKFGSVLAVGDFNSDGFDDLVVTVANRATPRTAAKGEVIIIFGSATGLQTSLRDGAPIEAQQLFPPRLDGLVYGQELDVHDFNNDGIMDLRISVAGTIFNETVDESEIYYGTEAGLTRNRPTPPRIPIPNPIPLPNPPDKNKLPSKDPVVQFPIAPRFLSPAPQADGSPTTLADTTPTINWTRVIGANEYDLVIYDKAGGFAVVNENGLKTSSFTTPQLTAGRVYQAFVRAKNSAGDFTPYSSPLEFKPIGDTKLPVGEFVATWSASTGAVSYDLIAYDVKLGKEIANYKRITGNSIDLAKSLSGIEEFTVYTRPQFRNGTTGNWTIVESFGEETPVDDTSADVLTTPTLLGPVGDSVGVNPRITWTESANAVTYEILIYNKDNGTEFLNKTGIEFESFRIQNAMDANTNYQVFVRGSNGSEKGAWSSPLEFKTGASVAAPKTPVFLLHKGIVFNPDIMLSSQPTIGWDSTTAGETYEILLYNKVTGQLVEQAKGLTEPRFTPSNKLDSSGEFQMFVRAVNANGLASAYSSPLEFTIKASSFSTVDQVFINPQVLFAI